MSNKYKGFIFDLDGTVYRGEEIIPGADETVLALRKAGKKVAFLSNKPLYTREDYAKKLTKLGIPTDANEVINSSYVMVMYLLEASPRAKIYVIGEMPLKNELKKAGFRITEDPREIQYVVVAFDRTFNYDKLNIAFQAIRYGAHFIATNPDKTCPVEDGEIPDCAAMIGAIRAATGKRPEVIVGKPSTVMMEVILSLLEVRASDCLIIGDRLSTDIAMGKNSGISTALVLTGVTKREDLKNSIVHPDYVLESIRDVLRLA
jgi:NagD protein